MRKSTRFSVIQMENEVRNKREGREKDGKRGIEMKNAWEGRDGRERREGGGKREEER